MFESFKWWLGKRRLKYLLLSIFTYNSFMYTFTLPYNLTSLRLSDSSNYLGGILPNHMVCSVWKFEVMAFNGQNNWPRHHLARVCLVKPSLTAHAGIIDGSDTIKIYRLMIEKHINSPPVRNKQELVSTHFERHIIRGKYSEKCGWKVMCGTFPFHFVLSGKVWDISFLLRIHLKPSTFTYLLFSAIFC